ncbi:hypothetical protein KR51_00018770 [Rubidibacter lacunae KORDI 51-2]|uniref:CHAD domain-containing protein n=1 Tax=Rubidibacter lacunae KORDI 51-2 TaxID=582515 RepID=U5DAB5_9CHRO|nr:CHAD domain-containing protein [Rubidibacter lacunae]ERN41518.1 hypothetical protein KR51_00018770 [Rubidibacter lacunae KORDI 51-2]
MTQSTLTAVSSLGDWAIAAIARHSRKIARHETEVRRDRDPEALHQLRVGMRRLRSALRGFAPVLEVSKTLTDKRVGRLARRLGRLRDLDVLREALERRYRPHVPLSEQDALDETLTRLDKQRRKARKQVQRTLDSKRYCALKTETNAWLACPRQRAIAQLPMGEVLPDLLLPEVGELLLHPGWFVELPAAGESAAPDSLRVEELLQVRGELLHDLRKAAKRARYQLELFASLYGDAYAAHVRQVEAVQTVLGEIQDTQVLEAFLANICGCKWAKSMPTLAELLRRARWEHWQTWQSLRQELLGPEWRRSLHAIILQGVRFEAHSNASSNKVDAESSITDAIASTAADKSSNT